MASYRRKKNRDKLERDIDALNSGLENRRVSTSLEKNVSAMKQLFHDVDIMRYKDIESRADNGLKCCLIYTDGLVNAVIINDNVIKPLMNASAVGYSGNLIDELLCKVIHANEAKTEDCFKNIIESVTYGDAVLFVDGCKQAAIINVKQFVTRAVTEPEIERTLSGPREGFTESLLQNLSLIRRRVRTHELKIKCMTLGKRTLTTTAVCYMEGLVNHDILDELFRRLNGIDVDGVLDTNYITELIRDKRYSPFRATGYTERPDVVVAKTLEGRIAIFLDGTPTVLTVPYLFIENFQSNEDYYFNFYYASFSRMLRIMGFMLTILIPAVYIAVGAFRHEMFPTQLFIVLASERQSVPLPASVEAFVMVLLFDILRETGVRMPGNIGQALSIVGALVIGQAAVEAKLVAAAMIIVVGATGITNLLVPKMNAPVILLRLFLLAAASTFGIYGLTLGLSAMLIHILNLTSLGVEQVALKGTFKAQESKDILIRAPWWRMVLRPKRLAQDPVRQPDGKQNE